MQKELAQLQIQQLRDLNKPNPYIQQLQALNKGVIDWHTNPNNTVKDIYKHPTLGGKLPVFQLAKTNRDAGRIGRGIVGITDKINPNYASDMALEDDFNRDMTASGMLEMGLQNELSSAEQNTMNLVMGDTQRQTSGNAMMSNFYNQISQQVAAGSWGNFFKGIIQGLVPMGASMLMGGMTGGGGGGAAGGAPSPFGGGSAHG